VKSLGPLYGLPDAERGRHPDDLWNLAVVDVMRALTPAEKDDLLAAEPKTARIRELDRLTLRQLLESRGLSPAAIRYVSDYYGAEGNLHDSATEYLREELMEYWTQGMDEIAGGTDRLPRAFADRLRSKPRAGCEVVRIEQDNVRGKVAAVYREHGRLRRAEGDRMICALPFPVVQRLEAEPAFSPEKAYAVRTLHYDSSSKVLAVCNTRFWETQDGIFGGGTYTDLPTGMTWYPANNAAKDPDVSRGPGVLLASYSWGMQARRMAALSAGQRHEQALQHVSRIHPQLREKGVVRHMASWAWDTFPLAGGAFAWFKPGQQSLIHRYVIAPEGRIHFAGEHASLAHTWMQGALESALRVVREIVTAG
jgi:monoamine oxidase